MISRCIVLELKCKKITQAILSKVILHAAQPPANRKGFLPRYLFNLSLEYPPTHPAVSRLFHLIDSWNYLSCFSSFFDDYIGQCHHFSFRLIRTKSRLRIVTYSL